MPITQLKSTGEPTLLESGRFGRNHVSGFPAPPTSKYLNIKTIYPRSYVALYHCIGCYAASLLVDYMADEDEIKWHLNHYPSVAQRQMI